MWIVSCRNWPCSTDYDCLRKSGLFCATHCHTLGSRRFCAFPFAQENTPQLGIPAHTTRKSATLLKHGSKKWIPFGICSQITAELPQILNFTIISPTLSLLESLLFQKPQLELTKLGQKHPICKTSLNFFFGGYVSKVTLPKTNIAPKNGGAVGIRYFPIGETTIFRGEMAVSFRDCIPTWGRKKPSYFPLYWLVNRDPYNGLLKSLYNWVV